MTIYVSRVEDTKQEMLVATSKIAQVAYHEQGCDPTSKDGGYRKQLEMGLSMETLMTNYDKI